MDYQEYLKSAKWRHTRDAAIERACNACQVCASTDRLEVHHNTYMHLGEERPHELIVLCAKCHTLFHSRMGAPHYMWQPDAPMDAELERSAITQELKAQKRAANLAWLRSVYGKKE